MGKTRELTINFLGDSITEGVGASDYEHSYVSVVGKILSLKEARNYGISGTRIAKQIVPYAIPSFDNEFSKRYIEMKHDADFNIIFGGTNDFGHGDAEFGNINDSKEKNTFCGCCRKLFSGIMNDYKESINIILTPLPRIDEENVSNGKKTLKEYVNAIKQLAQEEGLIVFDLYELSKKDIELKKLLKEGLVDNVHPNDLGHKILAKKIANFILEVEKNENNKNLKGKE